jgi:hypothetical protein
MGKNTVKYLEIERNTHEIFKKLCNHFGVNIYTMANFMLTKGIISFLEGTEDKGTFSEDEMLHIYGMDSSLEIILSDEMRKHALKKMIEGMLEVLN